jgi:hypothetical protein
LKRMAMDTEKWRIITGVVKAVEPKEEKVPYL